MTAEDAPTAVSAHASLTECCTNHRAAQIMASVDKLISLASFGDIPGELLQALVVASITWATAEQTSNTAQLVGPLAIKRGDRPDRVYQAALLREQETRRSLEEAARAVSAWIEAHMEP